MTVYLNGREQSRVIWKAADFTAMTDLNRAVDLVYTDLDLTAYTSLHAKFAMLLLRISPDVVGTGSWASLKVRRNGDTPAAVPLLNITRQAALAAKPHYAFVVVGLGPFRVIEYSVDVTADWIVDTYIYVLGYSE